MYYNEDFLKNFVEILSIQFFHAYQIYDLSISKRIAYIAIITLVYSIYLIWTLADKFLAHKIWMLYFYYRCIFLVHETNNRSKKFDAVCQIFTSKWSLLSLVNRLAATRKRNSHQLIALIQKGLFISCIIMMIITIVLDFINVLFIFLIFYYVIYTFVRTSEAVTNYYPYLWGETLIRKTYGFPKIVYVNMSAHEELLLLGYIQNPKIITALYTEHIRPAEDHSLMTRTQFKREFTLIPWEKGEMVYANYYQQKLFKLAELKYVQNRYFVHDNEDLEAQEYYKFIINKTSKDE